MKSELTIDNLHEEIKRIAAKRNNIREEISELYAKSSNLGKDILDFLAHYLMENCNGKILKFIAPMSFSDACYFEWEMAEKPLVYEAYSFNGFMVMNACGKSRTLYKERNGLSDAICRDVNYKSIDFKITDGKIDFLNCEVVDEVEYAKFLERFNADMAITDSNGNHVTEGAYAIACLENGKQIACRITGYDADKKLFSHIPVADVGTLSEGHHIHWSSSNDITLLDEK